MLKKCNSSDLFGVMQCVMQGVDLNFLVGDFEQNKSLLSEVVICGTASTYVLELLIQNGAQVYASDINGKKNDFNLFNNTNFCLF